MPSTNIIQNLHIPDIETNTNYGINNGRPNLLYNNDIYKCKHCDWITNKISDILVSYILNLIMSQFQTFGASGGGGLGRYLWHIGHFLETGHLRVGYLHCGGLCRKQKNKTNNKLGFNIKSHLFRWMKCIRGECIKII